jgi:hypothetical protein
MEIAWHRFGATLGDQRLLADLCLHAHLVFVQSSAELLELCVLSACRWPHAAPRLWVTARNGCLR